MKAPDLAAGWRANRGAGSINGMTTSKIAISIPAKVLAKARRAAKRERAPSLSAYITAAIEQKTSMDDLDRTLDEMLEATGGPITAAERKAADRILLGRRRRR
jgi:hypothetical protein